MFDDAGALLAKEGAEFGATTGRPRRCGWIDLPQLRYTIMLNGVTQLVVTKIDVLNKFKNIKAANSYIQGEEEEHSEELPYDLCDENYKAHYDVFPGWEQGLEKAATYAMLPNEAKGFVEMIESKLDVRVSMVSIGPGRRELLEKV